MAIDPLGCRCTECMVGEYVPLEQATGDQVRAMILGMVADHTGEEFTYRDGEVSARSLSWRLYGGGR